MKLRENRNVRHQRILERLNHGEIASVVLSAAAELEWTWRRAILALGDQPNREIRARIRAKCHGPQGYRDTWQVDVGKRLEADLCNVVPNWIGLTVGKHSAFALRNELIHGNQQTTGNGYAGSRVRLFLNAASAIYDFARVNGVDLDSRLPVRRIRRAH